MSQRGYRGRPMGEVRPLTWPATLVGFFLLVVGLFMLGYWGNYILSGNLPDGLWTVENNNYLVYHLGAEGLTALIGVLAGFGLLRGRLWGVSFGLVALGGLLYTTINSLGYSTLSEPGLTPVFAGVLGGVLLSFIGLHFGRG